MLTRTTNTGTCTCNFVLFTVNPMVHPLPITDQKEERYLLITQTHDVIICLQFTYELYLSYPVKWQMLFFSMSKEVIGA